MLVLASLNHCHPSDERLSLVIRQLHRLLVAYPQVDTTPTRVDPEEVFVAKVLTDRLVEDLHCDCNERPTPRANGGIRAARSDGVVICHINIEYELALDRLEGASSREFLVSWLGGS